MFVQITSSKLSWSIKFNKDIYKLKLYIDSRFKIETLKVTGEVRVRGDSEPELYKIKLWKIFLKSKNINQKVKKIFLHLQEL